jgi:diguanylate cyclase (GGDEF)-like protein
LLSLCVADLDHFKEVNDRHGHLAGDAVLNQLGVCLGAFVGTGERIGRWGGDEFLLLLPRLDLGEARARAEDARRAVEETAFGLPDGTSLKLTVTIGVTTGRGEALEANRLFRAADADLVETKRGGRNRVGQGRLP